MSLLLLKKKVAAKAPPVIVSPLADLIDLCGTLEIDAEPVAADIKKLQEKLVPLADARKELEAKIAELGLDPDVDGHKELGYEFRLEVNKCGSSRSIKDVKQLHKLLGDELFYKLAAVKLTDIDKYLTLPQRDKVLNTARTKHSYSVSKVV